MSISLRFYPLLSLAVTMMVSGTCMVGATQSRLVRNLDSGKSQVIVTYGTSLTERGAWVGELERALQASYAGQVEVINSGGSGMWSQWGVKNLEDRVIQKKPDAVFIEFAINDCVARFDCSVTMAQKNLETMIERVLQANPDCEIILMTMTPGNKYPEGHPSHRQDIEPYYEMYRKVAAERDLLLIDHYPHWKKLQDEDEALFLSYVPDTIHPTATGCAKVMTPVLLKAIGL